MVNRPFHIMVATAPIQDPRHTGHILPYQFFGSFKSAENVLKAVEKLGKRWIIVEVHENKRFYRRLILRYGDPYSDFEKPGEWMEKKRSKPIHEHLVHQDRTLIGV